MAVRKRTWTTTKGERREAWIADYVDQAGERHIKTFDRKKEADAFVATATVEVREGTHVADSTSVTVKEAGALWIATAEKAGLERTTLDQYRGHLTHHLEPLLGRTLLSQLNAPTVRAFEDRLRDEGRTPTLTRYVLRSLGSLLADAQERGLVVRNSVRELRGRRRRGKDRRADGRAKGKLKIGVDIPTPSEVKAILGAAQGRWRPFLLTAIFTGLRASELRGLRWSDVDLRKNELHVRQRADRYRALGKPKTEAGERSVPLPPTLVATLREWKLACPPNKQDLVFPTVELERKDGTKVGGTVQSHPNIIRRGLIPTLIAAGVTVTSKGEVEAKYTGMHAMRHFYASWCINRKVDGGLELPAKVVQHRLGHSSIMVTLDTYGHLFPSGDDGAEMAEAERALLG